MKIDISRHMPSFLIKIVYSKPMSKNIKYTIEQTFLELLSHRPISEITIKEITTKSGVNRNTFYYHYKNLADLLESVICKMVDEIIVNQPLSTNNSLEDCFLSAVNFAITNRKIINNIYHSTNRAIFERHLWHICDYSISSFLGSLPNQNTSPVELDVIKDILKFELFGFTIDWINHGMPSGVTEKIHILTANLLPKYPNKGFYGNNQN